MTSNTNQNKDSDNLPKFKGMFMRFFSIIIGISIIISVIYIYYYLLSNDILNDFSSKESEIISIVSKFSNKFNPTEVNSTKYGKISETIVKKTLNILSTIQNQLFYSLLIIFVAGFIWILSRTITLRSAYNVENEIYKSDYWLNSASSIPTTISGAISIGITLVGAVSLLSPEIVGGYIISGLITLIICVFVHIFILAFGTDIVKSKIKNNEEKIIVKKRSTYLFEGLISIQFLLLAIGLSLLILQIISY